MEQINDALKRCSCLIEIVWVELDREATATAVVYGKIPAPPDAQIVRIRYDVNEVRYLIAESWKNVSGAVCRMVVNYDDIKPEFYYLYKINFILDQDKKLDDFIVEYIKEISDEELKKLMKMIFIF